MPFSGSEGVFAFEKVAVKTRPSIKWSFVAIHFDTRRVVRYGAKSPSLGHLGDHTHRDDSCRGRRPREAASITSRSQRFESTVFETFRDPDITVSKAEAI